MAAGAAIVKAFEYVFKIALWGYAFAQLSSKLVQGSQVCHYGMQPGYWTPNPKDNYTWDMYTWNLYDHNCQIKDYLSQYIEGSGAKQEKKNILFFGDSVDYRFISYYCNELGLEPELFGHPDLAHLHVTGICRNNSSLVLAKQHLSGANLHGPYWNNINFPPESSIDEGLKLFRSTEGEPDIVVVSSNFWDLAGWFFAANWTMVGSVMENETIPNSVLHQWGENMTQILTHLKDNVHEDTLLIFHTLHAPRWHQSPAYWENDRYIDQHVSQLNAIGRHVAQSLHYHILDLELMALQVHMNSYLRDSTHPQPWFILAALNVMLNMETAASERKRILAEQITKGGFVHWLRHGVGKRHTLRRERRAFKRR
eukprot:jgi/Botrbrau1/9096/Bobra.0305s0003.1